MTQWMITGVSSGLGAALARAVLARGDGVAGTVRSAADREAFEALAPDRARGFLLDVTDEAALREAIAAAEAASGGLDVLVNNAGYGLVGAVEEASLAEARAQFEVNLFAPLVAIQAVLPFMRARRAGHIVNITSVSGLATWAGTGVYCASKFALEGLTETLAQEVAEIGIRVTNVAPGGLRTNYAGRSLAHARLRLADYDGLARDASRILAEHAGSEPGDPAKVAAAILKVVDDPAPPMHLLLGADALGYAAARIRLLQAEMERWRALSLSTGAD
ncbi:MAG TPA: oxidoreductase [Caulobacteraceae bacterium]|jgi:NAD(P)-dependent dehydrogenase (short-subunit alcohol dehydrogenase family)